MISNVPQFHPLLKKWFFSRFSRPTDVQTKSWPLIASGRHVLITAPTGSGKTFAAFLWAINQLITGEWSVGATCLLYVSPLKALNNDIRENLLLPLADIRSIFHSEGVPFPLIGIMTRSGDTPGSERQRMLRHPPEIVITTPESLNLMLSTRKARSIFSSIRSVILDEVHSVVSTKRGSHLISAVDRLVPIAGEFQRIALSATVKPLERVAEFIGGYRITQGEGKLEYLNRPLSIVESTDTKQFQVQVKLPVRRIDEESLWPALVRECRSIIGRNRSTLIFTNTRRLAEKIAWMINEGEERGIAYSHHGSLSKEIRRTVEKQLRGGRLSAIVATSSLELGIDIGALDEVVLIQSPPSVVSGIQRIGRAGHSVGQVSRGIILSTHGRDLVDAAVCARGILDRDIEEAKPVREPLDVLAQVIVSMVGVEHWNVDKLFAQLKASYPFHALSRQQFDLVLEMLTGRYVDTRIRELSPRIILDRQEKEVHGREGILSLVYQSGGTIPDRGYYGLIHRDTGSKIGELDEEFVWERKIGDTFSLGAQSWQITRIDSQNVEVIPWRGAVGIAPFWKAERGYRGFHLFERISLFLEQANRRLFDPDFYEELLKRYHMEGTAVDALMDFLKRQKIVTESDLPHRHHVLIEHVSGPLRPSGNSQVFIFTFWGGRVNKPLSFALSAAWEERFGDTIDVFSDDDAILLVLPSLPDDQSVVDLLHMVRRDTVLDLLRKKLEQTGFFGARFRENAQRALLLPRRSFQKRMPLWLNRLRSKKLFHSVSGHHDFPITIETWRECLEDEFEMESLTMLLDELECGRIALSETWTDIPSPFAQGLLWWGTNTYVYADDSLKAGGASMLSEEIFRQVLFSDQVRPQIDREIVQGYQQKLHRESRGYAPGSGEELLEWVKERTLIPPKEWDRLIAAIERDHGVTASELLTPIKHKIAGVRLPGAAFFSVVAVQSIPRVLRAFQMRLENLHITPAPHVPDFFSSKDLVGWVEELEGEDGLSGHGRLVELLAEWLYSYGPVEISYITSVFGVQERVCQELMAELAGEERVVLGRLIKGVEIDQVCDAQNLESLLRLTRAASRPSFQALAVKNLQLFLAHIQGLVDPGGSPDDLKGILEQLFGYPAHVELWESEIFPARLKRYAASWLDSLFSQSDLMWFGCGTRRASFCFITDRVLLSGNETDDKVDTFTRLFPDLRGRYSFQDLLARSPLDSPHLWQLLWEELWKGRVFNDSWSAIRSRSYEQKELLTDQRHARRIQSARWNSSRWKTGRWKTGRFYSGNWYVNQWEEGVSDAIEELEMNKEKVRQLLLRYGLLFRELMENELPTLRWNRLFRTLRIMELSGELIGGHFFQGIRGLQFISHQAFRLLQKGLREDAVYWMNACDPASLCGVKLEGLDPHLPSRIPSNHIVYRGTQVVLISRRNGKELEIFVPPEDTRLKEYLGLFRTFVSRDFHPETSVKVEQINGEAVHKSPYSRTLSALGFRNGYRSFSLERDF